jgi:hypothetical protein
MARIPPVAAAILVYAARSAAGQPAASDPRVGCYRASRPLGTAAEPHPERDAPGLETFRLLEGGRVERPQIGREVGYSAGMAAAARAFWARGSRWAAAGDTLAVTLSTGTSGWALRLQPATGGAEAYAGEAHYLTDVVVRDTLAWRPRRAAVRVTRVACAPPARRGGG